MNDRAYYFYNNQWKHVYIIERFTQVDIFGNDVQMARIKLTTLSRNIFEVEADKLKQKKPARNRSLA